jgi:signal transduction histidine kinase
VPDGRIPTGTEILFQPPRVWDRVRPYAIAAAAVMTLQAALIALLLMQQGALKRAQLRIRNLGSRLVSAQDQERARIAAELHDDVSQQLAMLSFDLQVLNGFGPTHDDDVEKAATEALQRLDQIGHSLRNLSHRLHPSTLRAIGLVRAVGDLLRDLARPGLTINFTHSDVPKVLREDITIALFRVAQEALRNALAHSGARRIAVHLQGDMDRIFLTVRDDGIGFNVASERGRGLGLISMRDRLDPIGGTVTVRSTPGTGTHVEVSVPTEHMKGGNDAEESLARRRPHDGARGAGDAADIGI